MGNSTEFKTVFNISLFKIMGNSTEFKTVLYISPFKIMGNSTEFKKAVQMVIDNLSFKSNTVQVFEATIRYMLYIL